MSLRPGRRRPGIKLPDRGKNPPVTEPPPEEKPVRDPPAHPERPRKPVREPPSRR